MKYLFLPIILIFASTPAIAQSDSRTVYHQIEGRIQHKTGRVANLRVRLLKLPEMRPIAETFSRPEGQFTFNQITAGEYSIETMETDIYEASLTNVLVNPIPRNRPSVFTVFVEVPLKPPPPRVKPGEVMADVDLNVPKEAQKHYQAGIKNLHAGKSSEAIREFQAAVTKHSRYYAARLELGRELRQQKRLQEAEEVLQPLIEIAPNRADPRLELGIVELMLNRRSEAIVSLREALARHETNWATHLYLGWALLETAAVDEAATHFQRALELDEMKAARAHLALARLAEAQGQREVAISHLEAYLLKAPKAHDAEATRRLADRLRSP
jgi:tetratricopeptide (TPR) repeat protein